MLPNWFVDVSVILAYLTVVVQIGRWLWKRWQKRKEPWKPKTQGTKDRAAYAHLLSDYEGNLDLLEEMHRLKVMYDAGPDEWTPEIEGERVETIERVYENLERHMGILHKLDIVESRNPSMTEQRMKRIELETRQAAIEQHLPPRPKSKKRPLPYD